MVRDLGPYREILLLAGQLPPGKVLKARDVPGHEPALVAEHMHLLGEEHFADVKIGPAIDSAVLMRLRAPGHDYLAAVRDPEVWSKTKESVGKRFGLATLAVFKETAIAIAAAIAAARFGH